MDGRGSRSRDVNIQQGIEQSCKGLMYKMKHSSFLNLKHILKNNFWKCLVEHFLALEFTLINNWLISYFMQYYLSFLMQCIMQNYLLPVDNVCKWFRFFSFALDSVNFPAILVCALFN